jgi:hypothetical protein
MATEDDVRAASYSTSIGAAAAGTPQRGSVHSVFAAAANIVFPTLPRGEEPPPPPGYPQGVPLLYTVGRPQGSPRLDEFVLSLNALDGPEMPNGLRLSVSAGAFPFTALRPGMSVLFGAQRLHVEAIECSLDLSTCPQWDPHIYHPVRLDRRVLEKNRERLAAIWNKTTQLSPMPDPPATPGYPAGLGGTSPSGPGGLSTIHALARHLCGRGVGLTPTGDDILAGWMAAGWLLYGATSDFLEVCQQIVEVAQQQTHLLSRCWLGYAARGDVASPIVTLLQALAEAGENEAQFVQAAQAVLAMGATSGSDVITGILLGLDMYLASPS